MSWDERMSERYDEWSADMKADVSFYVDLASDTAGPLVELAVGNGRVAIVLDDGGTSSLWWATKNEWLGLIDVAGLELQAIYGDFDRTPLTSASREYIFIATTR